MTNLRKNIIRIFLSAILLTSGNFAFAISHADCFSDESGHHKCEMECCKEDDCCSEEQDAVKITDENNGCCETHIEQAVEQDNAVLVINNPGDNLKYSVRTFTPCSDNILCSEGFSEITHKFKTTNIPVEFSNLRI